jgi:hypothetical protein
MMIDRHYIFDKVVWHLKQETKFYSSDAFRKIAEDIRYPKANYSAYLASGVWTIDMPDDFIKVDETDDITFKAGDTSSIIKITPKTRKLIGRDQILAATPSTPEHYFMEDQNTMGFYPPSSTSGGIMVIPYVKTPTSLSSDTDTNELTERAYQAVIYWTVSQCLLMGDDERFPIYQQLYNTEILRLQRQFGEMYEEDKDMIPDERYTG